MAAPLPSAPAISDHALLRFLERTGALEVEALRASMAASLARAHRAARAMGGGDYLIVVDGLTYVVRGEVVTTVMVEGSTGAKARSLGKAK